MWFARYFGVRQMMAFSDSLIPHDEFLILYLDGWK